MIRKLKPRIRKLGSADSETKSADSETKTVDSETNGHVDSETQLRKLKHADSETNMNKMRQANISYETFQTVTWTTSGPAVSTSYLGTYMVQFQATWAQGIGIACTKPLQSILRQHCANVLVSRILRHDRPNFA